MLEIYYYSGNFIMQTLVSFGKTYIFDYQSSEEEHHKNKKEASVREVKCFLTDSLGNEFCRYLF